MDYLISVIIPVFNADKKSFLSVLNCVRNQQREDFPIEKIIVFDGDPSFEIHRIIALNVRQENTWYLLMLMMSFRNTR